MAELLQLYLRLLARLQAKRGSPCPSRCTILTLARFCDVGIAARRWVGHSRQMAHCSMLADLASLVASTDVAERIAVATLEADFSLEP